MVSTNDVHKGNYGNPQQNIDTSTNTHEINPRKGQILEKIEVKLQDHVNGTLTRTQLFMDLHDLFSKQMHVSFDDSDTESVYIEELRKSLATYKGLLFEEQGKCSVVPLSGVSASRNFIKDRHCDHLINFEIDISANDTSKTSFQKDRYFSSSNETDRFLRLFDLIGTDAFNLTEDCAFKQIYFPTGTNAKHSDEKDCTQSSLTLYVVPIGELDFSQDRITISHIAMDFLTRIQYFLENGFNEQARISCRNFFCKFGSHIYISKHVVGGYFLLRTDSRAACTNGSTRCHANKLEQIKMSLVSLNAKEEVVSECGVCRHFYLRKGIPDIKVTQQMWETILIEYPNLSDVISHGSFQMTDYEGIWKIIGEKNLFKDQNKDVNVGRFLHKVWEDIQCQNIYDFSQQSSLPSSDVKKCIQHVANVLSKESKLSIFDMTNILSDLCGETQHSNADTKIKWRLEIEKNGIIEKLRVLVCDRCERDLKTCCELFIDFLHHTELYIVPGGRKAFVSVIECTIQNENKVFTENVNKAEDTFVRKIISMLVNMEVSEAKTHRHFSHYLSIMKALNDIENVVEKAKERNLQNVCWGRVKKIFKCLKKRSLKDKNDLARQISLLKSVLGDQKLIDKIKEVVKITPFGVHPKIRAMLMDQENIVKEKLEGIKDLECTHESLEWSYFEKLEMDFFEHIEHLDSHEKCKELVFPFQAATREMFDSLGLTDKYPGKISLHDVQSQIDFIFDQPEKITDIPWTFLREIIASNYSFREMILEDFYKKRAKEKPRADLLSDLFSKRTPDVGKGTDTSKKASRLHPSDVLLAIYLCSDMHLQKILANKIASCQLALPFIYPRLEDGNLVALTWSIREVMVGAEGLSVYSSRLPIVGFVRIGQCKFRSKSKLINELLRGQNEEHATFFHRDCSLGQLQREISNGVIELSWFLPSTDSENSTCKTNEEENSEPFLLTKPLAILNLRGDGNTMAMQINVMCQITNILVVLIDFESFGNFDMRNTMSNIHSSKSKVILVTNIKNVENAQKPIMNYSIETKMDHEKTSLISVYDSEADCYKNTSDVKCLLTNEIARALDNNEVINRLENVISESSLPLIVDENNISCKTGQKFASTVYNIFKETGSKSNVLPLQGEDLWQILSVKEKERNRVGNVVFYDPSEKTLSETDRIKEEQFKRCVSNSDFAIFVENLYMSIFSGNSSILLFFLSWLKLQLDNSSREKLRHHQKQFREALLKYQMEKSKINKSMLEQAERELANSSFGLEHCFREIGQVYEAFTNVQNLKTRTPLAEKTMIVYKHLPKIVAKLLLLGQPFELMDGDAANVPLNWIRAVFGELKTQMCDAKVFVVSVLGIQSSGKSTLLNSMFGLQFAVSAGRCTRGIFIQLVPVKSSRLKLGCDYIMIVDTEGLRAPELSGAKVHHDNELATLVIGMADYTILNIKGETIADLENVLQIVVHALLRLKQANKNLLLRQSCVLVHQNVSAQDAEKQMQHGHHKTIQNLDYITKEVAVSEHLDADYKSFSDVIKFDPSSCIKFVPDLWHGTPPMAPVNTKYSSKITDLTKHMLDVASRKKYLTISDTLHHFESLWNGILKEDFVFSFRNCLEVKAYSILETEYQRLAWKLEETQIEWFDEKATPYLSKYGSESDLDIRALTLIKDFSQAIDKTKIEVEQDLKHFMEKSALKEQMVQWKEPKLNSIRTLVSELKESFKQKVQNTKTHNKIEFSSKNLLHEKEKQINEHAQKLAITFKGTNPSPEDLSQKFETMWTQWLAEIEKQVPQQSNDDRILHLRLTMEKTLYDEFNHHSALLDKEFNQENLQAVIIHATLEGSFSLRPNDHLSTTGIIKKAKKIVGFSDMSEHEEEVMTSINSTLRQIDEYLKTLSKQDKECSNSEFKVILKYLKNLFSNQNNKDLKKFHFIKHVLEFLCNNSDFDDYKKYLASPEEFSLTWLRDYVANILFDHKGSNTFFVWTENETQRVISQVERSLNSIGNNDENIKSMSKWKSRFEEEVGQHISLKSTSLSHVMDQNVSDVENFNKCIIDGLCDVKSRLQSSFKKVNADTVKWIGQPPVDDVFDAIWGCKEVCPWCGEPCHHEANHLVKHHCIQHRPAGFGGVYNTATGNLVIESCNFHVQSTNTQKCGHWCGCTTDNCEVFHPYREYAKYMPCWDIAPRVDMTGSKYWTWFMCTFQDELANYRHRFKPEIPPSWMKITKEEAIESLSEIVY
ncbi:hypothetical protein FSP39_011286 [Pinctada imbricata]|uniref:VLIG-type G domain-containing protein n=1 Tax=Pinctada imbricata TaxID=66713 RepID=A0AA88XN75_PINIB|nr:hypothetical protein FSP39_011286 [Pinctada imbricata]